ncbi:MAG: tRNA (cytidine(56)-2'-O)-methyltransferase, partial [Candidatus Aenigmatarchaeota archaeon]
VSYEKNWRKVIKEYKEKGFCIIHLTMYGMPIQKKIRTIRKNKKILVIIGSEKVPGEVYELSNFNISVTSQPHSEVAALAIFIDKFFGGKELYKKFKGANKIIISQEKGKKLMEK